MIGESALVEAFLGTVRASVEGAPIGFGQCVEQHGQEELGHRLLTRHHPLNGCPLEVRAEYRRPSAFRRCSPMGPPGASYVPTVSSLNGEHSSPIQSWSIAVCTSAPLSGTISGTARPLGGTSL